MPIQSINTSSLTANKAVNDNFPSGEDVGALVLDLGTYLVRYGNAGEDTPKQVWQSCVGTRILEQSTLPGITTDVEMKGAPSSDSESTEYLFPMNWSRCLSNVEVRNCLTSHQSSLVFDCGAFEAILSRITGTGLGLGVSLEGRPILVADPSRHSRSFRTQLTELLFERFEVEALYLAKQAVLSAFSVGRSSGCVVDIGASGLATIPVQDGYTLQKALFEYEVGGDYLDKYLSVLLKQQNYKIMPQFSVRRSTFDPRQCENLDISGVTSSYIKYGEVAAVRYIKEAICRCARSSKDFKSASADLPVTTVSHELPDGTPIASAEELGTRLAEVLIDPSTAVEHEMLQREYPGLSRAIMKCIQNCDFDIRRELLSAVILVGGCSTIPGLSDRLAKALQEDLTEANSTMKVKLSLPSLPIEQKFSSWLGGSILASLSTFQQLWFSREEYQEHGSYLVERKCLQ